MFRRFCEEKGFSKSTESLYRAAVKSYLKLNEGTLTELLQEADQEELDGIRWKDRKLRQRLIQFRQWLFQNKEEGTAKRYLNCVKTIYRHFEIELHTLPSYNSKNINKTYEKKYEDILTKDEIIGAYHEANNVEECIILLGISSGLSKVDMLKLTVDDILTAVYRYFDFKNINFNKSVNLIDTLFDLKDYPDTIIPIIEGERQKTKSSYTTFCSPEAITRIIYYLIGRDVDLRDNYEVVIQRENRNLNRLLNTSNKFTTCTEIISFIEDYVCNNNVSENTLTELNKINKRVCNAPKQLEPYHKLFDVTNAHLLYSFRKINNKLKLGYVGKYTKFRCHQLRAYHASTLLNLNDNPFTESEVDELQGRKKDLTHRAYFKESLTKLYNKYYESVDSVMLFTEIHGVDEETIEKLEQENKFYKNQIVKNQSKLEEQKRTIDKIIENQRELEALLGL